MLPYGHSGMSVLNAIKKGLQVNHASHWKWRYEDIIDDFIAKLELKPTIGTLLFTL
jgi:hypothetical protein